MKYFLVFSLFSCCLLDFPPSSLLSPPASSFTSPLDPSPSPEYYNYVFKPMKDRDRNFGNDVCFYKNTSGYSYDAYVKPCEEGKTCKKLRTGTSAYEIYTCQDSYKEVYNNVGEACKTKDEIKTSPGIDCTGTTCNSDSKCLDTGICPKNQFLDKDNHCQSSYPGYCKEYEFETNGLRKTPAKTSYTPFDGKDCIQIDLRQTNNANKIYDVEKVWANYYASIEDGKFINDNSRSLFYCKSGYALYFYGNGDVKNPNEASPNNEQLYLRCVTITGRDASGILKYKIGDGDEKYYNPAKYPPASTVLKHDDPYLMKKLEFFKNFRERLEGLDCKETNNCEDNELSKWLFFYYYPEYQFLYEKEPQVLEFLIQIHGFPYKAKHTSPDASSFLNIKYLTLLALLLLF